MLRAECVRAFRSRDSPARRNATRRAHNRHVDDGSSPTPGDTGRAGGGTALGAQLPRAEGSWTTNKTSRRSFLAVAAGALLLRGRTWDDSAAAAEQRRLGCADAAPPSSPFEVSRYGPIEIAAAVRQVKDPCPVFDGRVWHLFGSAWAEGVDGCSILHAQAGSIEGPYAGAEAATLVGVSGPQLSAPGVIHDGALFHMFIQTAFSSFGGTIEHLVSVDGARFDRVDTALTSDLDHDETCIYDAQPAVIDGDLYLAFAAATTIGQPELHACRSLSGTWSGPWERLGPILRQAEVPFHNIVGCRGYEWGLEGPQLVQLPTGEVLLLGVCFLAGRRVGTRQRVFIAIADTPRGPYRVLGPLLDPAPETWESGENGHAGAVLVEGRLMVVYQARRGAGKAWRCGLAELTPPTST